MRKCALFLFLVTACASMSDPILPSLENRTLRLSSKVPGFEYQWMVCVKKILGFCRQWEPKVEYYDLTDPEVMTRLQTMGFVARVREKVTP